MTAPINTAALRAILARMGPGRFVVETDDETSLGNDSVAILNAAVPLLDEVDRLRVEVERVRMDYGRQMARCAVFTQAMSWLARNGMRERAKQWIERADAAAADVRPEDFVVAKVARAALKGEP